MLKVLIIDGQGGRLGMAIVDKLISTGAPVDITVVGTNSAATAAMIKAGAKKGATGENPVVVNAARADVIAGPIGIIAANALMGEITPVMAQAIASCEGEKVLVPITRCGITVAGVTDASFSRYVDMAVAIIADMAKEEA